MKVDAEKVALMIEKVRKEFEEELPRATGRSVCIGTVDIGGHTAQVKISVTDVWYESPEFNNPEFVCIS
jgi:hypothetical protein